MTTRKKLSEKEFSRMLASADNSIISTMNFLLGILLATGISLFIEGWIGHDFATESHAYEYYSNLMDVGAIIVLISIVIHSLFLVGIEGHTLTFKLKSPVSSNRSTVLDTIRATCSDSNILLKKRRKLVYVHEWRKINVMSIYIEERFIIIEVVNQKYWIRRAYELSEAMEESLKTQISDFKLEEIYSLRLFGQDFLPWAKVAFFIGIASTTASLAIGVADFLQGRINHLAIQVGVVSMCAVVASVFLLLPPCKTCNCTLSKHMCNSKKFQ